MKIPKFIDRLTTSLKSLLKSILHKEVTKHVHVWVINPLSTLDLLLSITNNQNKDTMYIHTMYKTIRVTRVCMNIYEITTGRMLPNGVFWFDKLSYFSVKYMTLEQYKEYCTILINTDEYLTFKNVHY